MSTMSAPFTRTPATSAKVPVHALLRISLHVAVGNPGRQPFLRRHRDRRRLRALGAHLVAAVVIPMVSRCLAGTR
ncbi:MAG TPA: hypothetical protein VFQ15_08385 [Jiangellaceae bacterium]|nr:hypothetical protein [Jiangellaceae bacterium]